MRRSLLVLATVAMAAAAVAAPGMAAAATGVADFTYDPSVEAAGGPATSTKPESKLIVTREGRWWAVLGDAGGVSLYGLTAGTWSPVLTLPGSDPWAKADVALSGKTLWLSLRDSRTMTGNTSDSRLYKLRYSSRGSWVEQAPSVRITTFRPEALTIDVAQDRVWATFIQNGAIRVGRLQTSGTSWAFITLPGVTAPSPDDLSQIVAFRDRQGAKIGVMWSDQALGIQRFAWRFAGSTLPLSEGWTIETAYGSGVGCSGPLCADDHINMKATGRQLFGVVKTSMTDVPEPNPDDPLIVLLRRNAAGKWSSTTVSPVSQNASRPMLQLAPTLDRLYVFAQLDFSGTYYWQSSLSAPAFDSMATTPWTVDGTTSIGNPTGTKQPLSTATGLVVATSNNGADTYWHNQVSLP